MADAAEVIEQPTPEPTPTAPIFSDVPVPANASLDEFRAAKRTPEKVVPVVAAEVDADLPAEVPGVPKKSRAEREQDRINESVRRAIEAYEAKRPNEQPRAEPRREVQPPAVEQKPAVQEPSYVRFMKMDGFPTADQFKEQGKTYDELVVAQQAFIAETLHEERTVQARERDQETQFVTREKGRYQVFSDSIKADAEIMSALDTARTSGQWPVNAPVSREVASLKPFSQIPVDAQGKLLEPATVYHAIAEKLMDSPVKTALMRHLSKEGNKELMRLAASPDPVALGVAIALIERDLQTPKPVKTETSLGEPLTALTSARATDPTDPEEAALRSNNAEAFISQKREKRLRQAGKR